VSAGFLESSEEEVYGYCTQFMIEGEGLDLDRLRARMIEMAHSTVVVGDERMARVHVHADDPGPVMSFGVSQGTLAGVNILNMDEQYSEFSSQRRQEVADGREAVEVAVVAVAPGDGLRSLFTSLGASGVVEGGDTMNPSVQDLLEAADRAPSSNVVILPNNRNIVPAARQAAESSAKNVRVVPSTSIPQGIAAVLALNPDRDLESTFNDMAEALGSVRTAEITEAVREVTLAGVKVEPGRLIGLLERDIVAVGDGPAEVLTAVLRDADLSDGDLVTLYWGRPIKAEAADSTMRTVAETFQGVEFELVEGGQPHYHFLVSIE
jgi:dihydroxyacetone kinase-like predicted kinase